jgi:lysophospholipase L1-like esterase
MQLIEMVRLAAGLLPCVALLSLTAMAIAQDPEWRDATDFEIEGNGWLNPAAPYVRLPDTAKGKINELAWELSKHSAGISVRFETNAPSIEARWILSYETLEMHHMPSTGVSGLDLYARSADGQWRFIGNGRPHQHESEARFVFPENMPSPRECLLYLPLYNGVQSLQIKVPAGSQLNAPAPRPPQNRQPLVVYGTSIAQGGCVSRPGLVWTSILGRNLDRPVINLGFSASGIMETTVGEVLAELDPAVYIIDCLWNTGDMSQEDYMLRISSLVESIRARHPHTPIVFVGQSLIWPEAHPTSFTLKQEAAVRALQDQGVQGLVIVPGDDLVGDDGEGTVDGVHLNDIGMLRQAEVLAPIVKDLLGAIQ